MTKKNISWGKFCVFLTALFTFTMALPVAFANESLHHYSAETGRADLSEREIGASLGSASMIYDRLNLASLGLSPKAFDYALCGMEKLRDMGKLMNDQIITIVDFSRPSSQKRLFIIDLAEQRLLYNTYVAHGQKSGKEFARSFSNRPESNQSSLGFYVTQGTYMGGNGYSLKLEGMERGINDKAADRAIVMHGAPYVNESLVNSQGYIGRSWGCPAVPEKLNRPIIETIKNGSCLFIYAEKADYFKRSQILNS